MAKLALAGQSYSTASLVAAAQTAINVYFEKIQDPQEREKSQAYLVGIPGRHLFKLLTAIDAAATPLRGLWTGGGRLFVFAGTKYFELSSAGALIGSVRTIVNAGNFPVQAFGNGNQLLIVSDSTVYIDNGAGPVAINIGASAGTVTTNGTLVTWESGDLFPTGTTWEGKLITINTVVYTVDTVSAPDQLYLTGSAGVQAVPVDYSQAGEALTGVTGAYLRNYFLVNRPAGGSPDLGRNINFSAVLDGSNWNAVDFFVKAERSDYVRSILAANEQLYAFGYESMQVYQVTADLTTPFQPIDGSMQMVGSCSAWGPISINNQVFFVGGSRGGIAAYRLDGFTPTVVSTPAIEQAWNTAGLGSACVSYAYQEAGHSFWVINFGTQTWAYDTDEHVWHERKIYNVGTGQFTPYLNLYHAYVEWPNGTKQHIVGGGSASIYDSSILFFDEAGADTKWQRDLPHQYNGGKRKYFGPMVLSAFPGNVTRLYSDDQGGTYSTAETPISMANGTKKWPAGGSSVDRIFRLQGVGQTKVALVSLDADIEDGAV